MNRSRIVWLVLAAFILLAMAPARVAAESAGLKRTEYNAKDRMRYDLLVLLHEEGNAALDELIRKLTFAGSNDANVHEAIKLVRGGSVKRARGCIAISYVLHQAAMPSGAEVVAYYYDDVSLPKKPKSHTVLEKGGENYQIENCHGLSAIEFPRSAVTADTRSISDLEGDVIFPLGGRVLSDPGALFKLAREGRNALAIAVVRQR